tara:strand:- start:1141 stop:2559 length:1419 start_codon:yes stop_codon:yes gene_type:complete
MEFLLLFITITISGVFTYRLRKDKKLLIAKYEEELSIKNERIEFLEKDTENLSIELHEVKTEKAVNEEKIRTLEKNSEGTTGLIQTAVLEGIKAAHSDVENINKKDMEKINGTIETNWLNIKENLSQTKEKLEKQIEGSQILDINVQKLLEQSSTTNKEIKKMESAFLNTNSRGDIGENILEDILRNNDLKPSINYTSKFNAKNSKEPDFVIHLDELHNLVLDSKFPYAKHRLALDEDDPIRKSELLNSFYTAVNTHANNLAKKNYQNNVESSMADVIMFLPTQASFSHLVENKSKVIDNAKSKGVIIMGPSELNTLCLGIKIFMIINNQNKSIGSSLLESRQEIQELYDNLSPLIHNAWQWSKSQNRANELGNSMLGSVNSLVSKKIKAEKIGLSSHNSKLKSLMDSGGNLEINREIKEAKIEDLAINHLSENSDIDSEDINDLGDDLENLKEEFYDDGIFELERKQNDKI